MTDKCLRPSTQCRSSNCSWTVTLIPDGAFSTRSRILYRLQQFLSTSVFFLAAWSFCCWIFISSLSSKSEITDVAFQNISGETTSQEHLSTRASCWRGLSLLKWEGAGFHQDMTSAEQCWKNYRWASFINFSQSSNSQAICSKLSMPKQTSFSV